MAMIVGRIILLFFVNSWMIIHLGKKPVRGGSPPSDSKVASVVVVINGILFHICDSDNVVVVELVINNMNMVVVIRI